MWLPIFAPRALKCCEIKTLDFFSFRHSKPVTSHLPIEAFRRNLQLRAAVGSDRRRQRRQRRVRKNRAQVQKRKELRLEAVLRTRVHKIAARCSSFEASQAHVGWGQIGPFAASPPISEQSGFAGHAFDEDGSEAVRCGSAVAKIRSGIFFLKRRIFVRYLAMRLLSVMVEAFVRHAVIPEHQSKIKINAFWTSYLAMCRKD